MACPPAIVNQTRDTNHFLYKTAVQWRMSPYSTRPVVTSEPYAPCRELGQTDCLACNQGLLAPRVRFSVACMYEIIPDHHLEIRLNTCMASDTCVAMYGYGYVWLCVAMYCNACLCAAMRCYVWLLFGYVWLWCGHVLRHNWMPHSAIFSRSTGSSVPER